jgi:large subunit ribosomal protein L4e
MSTARPIVSVFGLDGSKAGETNLPAVMTAPIRSDLIQFVHYNMAMNSRQAYSVGIKSGKQVSASSWGTGRAVARIPRVGGGGTSRSGQGAFGNMCRGGRMFAPTKTWRKWHRKINLTQKRYAVASAIAATAVPALVMARGHRIEEVPEIPLVLDNSVETQTKTKEARAILTALGAYTDVEKVIDSKKIRAGKGKARNRRYVKRRGPLVIYSSKEGGIERAFRNLPGVELCCVSRLNLLQLAPGGHMGRFCVWSQSAFDELDSIYGADGKRIPRATMSNADLVRIINSDEIQSVVNPAKRGSKIYLRKKNPLKSIKALEKLDAYDAQKRRAETLKQSQTPEEKAVLTKAKRARRSAKDQNKAAGKKFFAEVSKQGDVCSEGFAL